MSFEEFRNALASMAGTLEAEREALEEAERAAREVAEKEKSGRKPQQLERFARVHVSLILVDHRNKSESFLVSYSDNDIEAAKKIEDVLLHLAKLEKANSAWFAEHGDPYLGNPQLA